VDGKARRSDVSIRETVMDRHQRILISPKSENQNLEEDPNKVHHDEHFDSACMYHDDFLAMVGETSEEFVDDVDLLSTLFHASKPVVAARGGP
jgi:hypothetical protein